MTKELRKAIMLRSKLKNIFNKNKTHFNWQKYKHKPNFCLNILKKTKKRSFAKLDVKDVADCLGKMSNHILAIKVLIQQK